MGWDLAATRDPSLYRVRLRWTLFGLLVISLALLARNGTNTCL
jgi:hypothetical protein